jgi:hypothetical protein
MITRRSITLAAALALLAAPPSGAAEPTSHDIVVYGGTSAGVTAAVQAARLGKSVVVVEPTRHLGGLSSAGLGMTDSGKHEVIGGLARDFYRRIRKHYESDDAWKWEKRADFKWWNETGDALWRFEPAVAESIFRAMLAEARVTVVEGERLDLANWGTKSGTAITEIRMESGRVFRGRVFIDATYEGDLMAKAGVSYHVGREANAVYGETLNGVQVAQATKHQFLLDVDPWRIPGDPNSGLLPTIQAEGPGVDGEGDHRVQAYCFRLCLTDVPENRRPWEKPTNYDPLRYEVLRRYLAAGWKWKEKWRGHHLMPNRKTDTNNSGGFSSDHIGANYAYPEGGYATRDAIVKDHEEYQKGFWYFLATDPGVPAEVREDVNRWGLPKDEFQGTGGWPHALYIRESRRMISDHVHTEMDCKLTRETPQPVGMGSYAIDSHNTQRYVDARGFVRNEGDVQVPLAAPYPISYLSIRPRATECTNLLVPVCCAASHIGYGSIRMEPVFMILGESAATAASLALDAGTSVQDVPYPALRQRLLADRQVLEWKKPAPPQ